MKKMIIKRLGLLSTLLLLTGGLLPVAALAAETPSVSYSTHVQNEGWQDYKSNGEMSGTAGKSYRLEGIKIKLDDQGYDLGVSYQTHIQNIGWEAETSRGWKSDDAMSGTEGLSYRLEAIQIKLTGADAAKFDIFYQVHAQNIGWLDWAKNGESAGTAGLGYRLEGIRIVIVPKGAAAPGKTIKPFVGNLTDKAFIDQLYGVWYCEKPQEVLTFSGYKCIFWIKSWSAGGAYKIMNTSENGGTILIPDYTVEGTKSGPKQIEFDFGTTNDNKMLCRIGDENWLEFTAAKSLGNQKYQLPYDTGTFRLSCPSSCDTLKKTGGEIRNGKTSPG